MDGRGEHRPQIGDRILYIITSIAEFDTGRRSTTKGNDRFSRTLVPVISESVHSMTSLGYEVDVYLIAYYDVSPARYSELRTALPDEVGLEVWDDAAPLGYERENSVERIQDHHRGLSRQHRYVIKDKFLYYDLFLCFEDDMLIRGPHVQHYVHVTDALYRLRTTGATSAANGLLPGGGAVASSVKEAENLFYGPMTEAQLARTIPGFVRVEAARRPGFQPGPERFEQIPVNYRWGDDMNRTGSGVDPAVCCHVSEAAMAAAGGPQRIPSAPSVSDLYFWETSIEALGVRKMPEEDRLRTGGDNGEEVLSLDWVLLLGGNTNEVRKDPSHVVGDYWSGRNGYFGDDKPRPDRKAPRYVGNQGGWMATRRQLAEWHGRWCQGGFLP